MKNISVKTYLKNAFRCCMLKLMKNVLILRVRPLKRHSSTKWIEYCDVVFVFKEFYPAVVGSLDQQLESREEEVPKRAMPYLKRKNHQSMIAGAKELKTITTAEFLVSLEVINATLKLSKTVAKK